MILQFVYVALATYALGGFLGYATHWVFHQPWSGTLYTRHLAHHERLYPASDFLSDGYRDAGRDSTAPAFAAILVAVVLPLMAVLYAFGVPAWAIAAGAVEAAVIGAANNYVHDALHVRGHFLERFRQFRRLRTAHRVHHANVRLNLGIFSFEWDRVFGTYRRPHLNE